MPRSATASTPETVAAGATITAYLSAESGLYLTPDVQLGLTADSGCTTSPTTAFSAGVDSGRVTLFEELQAAFSAY